MSTSFPGIFLYINSNNVYNFLGTKNGIECKCFISYSIFIIYTFDINELITISGPFSIYILKIFICWQFSIKGDR